MPPKTRKPTGRAPWPFVLVAGEDKGGKSLNLALFSRLRGTGKIGACYWLDLGEGSADEYAALPGVDYDVLEHDGTFRDILARVLEVNAEAQRAAAAGEPPVVLFIDSIGAFWKMLSLWTTNRAARSTSNRRKLDRDPDADIDVAVNYWNDANDRNRQVVDILKGFPGIVIATARLKEVTVLDGNGRPIANQKDWKADAQKDVPYDATATIHQFREPRSAVVHTARSIAPALFGRTPVDVPVPDLLADPDSAGYLPHVIFDLLGCGEGTQGRAYQRLDENLVDRFIADAEQETDQEALRALWQMVNQAIPPSADRQRVHDVILARKAAIEAGDADRAAEERLPGADDVAAAREAEDAGEAALAAAAVAAAGHSDKAAADADMDEARREDAEANPEPPEPPAEPEPTPGQANAARVRAAAARAAAAAREGQDGGAA